MADAAEVVFRGGRASAVVRKLEGVQAFVATGDVQDAHPACDPLVSPSHWYARHSTLHSPTRVMSRAPPSR